MRPFACRCKPVAPPPTRRGPCSPLSACTSTALRVLDEKSVVVGQLNAVDNTKTYLLPVRVVYLVKDGPGAAKHLADLQHKFDFLDLTSYLNKHLLNQAHIKVAFERTNHVHQLVFKEAEWAGKYYDVAHQWLNDYARVANGVRVKSFLLEKVLKMYSAKYEKPGTAPFRGILLVMTNLDKDPADKMGGVSRVRPVEFREAIIYGTNLTDQETYAHELAHAMGLDHTFINENARLELEQLRTEVHQPNRYAAIYTSGKKYYAETVSTRW